MIIYLGIGVIVNLAYQILAINSEEGNVLQFAKDDMKKRLKDIDAKNIEKLSSIMAVFNIAMVNITVIFLWPIYVISLIKDLITWKES